MSILNEKLKKHRRAHKLYKGLYVLYEEYFESLPVRFMIQKNKKDSPYNIIFYPQKPKFTHTIFQICQFGGIKTTDSYDKFDLAVRFEDTTYATEDKKLDLLAKKTKILNYSCRDISKSKVGQMHKEAFGYDISVDPASYKEKYVKKSSINSLHDGIILEQNEFTEDGFVYQKLVRNIKNDYLVELRIPIIGGSIPFVYKKTRPTSNRFGSTNLKVKVVETNKIITADEEKKIIKFSKLMGLDFGELDVLRDFEDNNLYVVDLNNTPTSPPFNITMKEYKKALSILTKTFIDTFLNFG